MFQSATEYPCNDIVAPETQLENLRKRVERSVLNSESLTKNRSGIANVSILRYRYFKVSLH